MRKNYHILFLPQLQVVVKKSLNYNYIQLWSAFVLKYVLPDSVFTNGHEHKLDHNSLFARAQYCRQPTSEDKKRRENL